MWKFGGVALTLADGDNPVLPTPTPATASGRKKIPKQVRKGETPFRLSSKTFAQSVRLVGPCAVARAACRDTGLEIEWPEDSCVMPGPSCSGVQQ